MFAFTALFTDTATRSVRLSSKLQIYLRATFVIISQNILTARHKSFGRATIVRHNIKHVLWRAIAARVAFYSRPGLCRINVFKMSSARFYKKKNSDFL